MSNKIYLYAFYKMLKPMNTARLYTQLSHQSSKMISECRGMKGAKSRGNFVQSGGLIP
jgi:hypothetical protein